MVALDLAAFILRPRAEFIGRDDLAVFGGRQCKAERRAQQDDVFFGGLVAQRGKGLALLFLERLVDGAAPGLIVLALEDRGQSGLEIVDQLMHRVVKGACTTGRQLDGDRPFGIDEIVDIDPVGRARPCARLFGQHGLDRVLHAGAVGADDKQIEAGLADLGAKPDRFERARLADQAVDRLQLRRRRELQFR